MAALAAFAVIARRGLRLCRRATSDYAFFLALGMTLMLTIPALVMRVDTRPCSPHRRRDALRQLRRIGDAHQLRLVLGLLVASADSSDSGAVSAPFAVSTRWLGRTLACATIVLVVWVRVQVASADDVLVRPQLGRQADGGMLF